MLLDWTWLIVVGRFLLLCNDALGLAAEFISCKFYWVKREANITQPLLKRFGLEIFVVFRFLVNEDSYLGTRKEKK